MYFSLKFVALAQESTPQRRHGPPPHRQPARAVIVAPGCSALQAGQARSSERVST